MTYSLRINYKSNERPFSTDYKPYGSFNNDAEAIKWAEGMQAGMGPDYSCQLLSDGKMIFDGANSQPQT